MRSDAAKVIAGALVIFGIIFLYSREINFLQNTLNLKMLMVSAVLTGVLLGLIFGYFFSKERKEILEKFQIFIATFLFAILLMPLVISLLNRQLNPKPPMVEQLELLRVETYAGSRFGQLEELKEKPDGFRAFLVREGEVLRLQKKESPFPGKKEGDLVPVPIYRGLFGIEYVTW